MNNDIDKILSQDLHNSKETLQNLGDALKDDNELFDNDEHFFEADAKEGLQQINQEKIPEIVAKLNANLKSHLKIKKRLKKKINEQTLVIITIATLLILVVVAFVIIKKMME